MTFEVMAQGVWMESAPAKLRVLQFALHITPA